MTPADLRALAADCEPALTFGPSPSAAAIIAAALLKGATARCAGDQVIVDGHGAFIQTNRATLEAAQAALAHR